MRTIFLALALLAAAPLDAQERLRPSQIASDTRPAVVTVRAFESDAEAGHGTGFLVREDGVLVTNHHVVDGADSLEVELENGEIYDNVYVVGRDERRDLILLQIPATGLPTLAVADDRDVTAGDAIYVMGHPLGLEYTFSDGLLSARRTHGGVTYLQISAPISAGSSGGPVLDERGRAIGVATLTGTAGQNLNIAIPARHVTGMLVVAGEPQPFDEFRLAAAERGDSRPLSVRAGDLATALQLTPDARDDLEQLAPWEQQVALQLLTVTRAAEAAGWTASEERAFGYVDEGHVATIELTLAQGTYSALGVCDGDCSDLNLRVLDENGGLLDNDELPDDVPMIEFWGSRDNSYTVEVEMAGCSESPCFYGVQLVQFKS